MDKMMLEAVMHFDGSCWPNPGPDSRCAFILRLPAGRTIQRCILLGEGTNNTAEYHGLLAGLAAALDEGVTDLEVYGDSKLVIDGVSRGPRSSGKPHLEALKAQAVALVKRFRAVDLNWVAREDNAEADALADTMPA